MPKDEWRRDKDRQHQRRARSEFAAYSHLVNYESSWDSDGEASRERDSVVEYLNDTFNRAPVLVRNRLTPFRTFPEFGDPNEIILLACALENVQESEVQFLKLLVQELGPPAIKELCRLLLLWEGEKHFNVLTFLKRLDESFVHAVDNEFETMSASTSVENRRKLSSIRNQIRLARRTPSPEDMPLIEYLNKLLTTIPPGFKKWIPEYREVPRDYSRLYRLLPFGVKTARAEETNLLRQIVMRVGSRAVKQLRSLTNSNDETTRKNALKILTNLSSDNEEVV